MKGNTYFFLFWLLLGIAVVYLSLQIPSDKARFLPLALSITIAFSGGVGLFGELRKKATKESRAEETTAAPTKAGQPPLVTAAWLISFILLMVVIGFPLAIFLYIATYLKTHKMGWIRSIAFGLGWAIIIYIVFDVVLRVDLYRGILYIPLYRFLP